MKRKVIITLILLTIVFLSGCKPKENGIVKNLIEPYSTANSSPIDNTWISIINHQIMGIHTQNATMNFTDNTGNLQTFQGVSNITLTDFYISYPEVNNAHL